MARRCDDATATHSSEDEVFDADFERALRAQSDGPHDDGTALDALKRAVRTSFDLARCLPVCEACLFGGSEFDRPKGDLEDRTVFETLWSQLRAAQRAGEVRAADAFLVTALILSSVVGAADLAQHARAEQKNSINDGECPALLLLDLLTTKNCN
jgi:hypothetical protein